jgi:hypothetical protein
MGIERYISELADVLKLEVKSFNAVIELLILEAKSLIVFDTAALAEVVERQGDLLSSIACLEKSRTDILEKISLETGVDRAGLTLSALADMAGEPLSKELLETGNVLEYLYEDMKRKKTANTILIRQGIMLVESDIRLLLKAAGGTRGRQVVYTRRRDAGWMPGGIRIDGKL